MNRLILIDISNLHQTDGKKSTQSTITTARKTELDAVGRLNNMWDMLNGMVVAFIVLVLGVIAKDKLEGE